ncbi:MliC family protein [Pseudooceanicola nanhaiensis]|uniref:MliC family protein n=1 Tax=Pseudooceanicola nanhaiensis TaxID=375761 RepID=UPI001CD7E15A|nr:MliC family protein [Pseudooceanicola nanhaiensis]MCA0920030.1 MliC family protein [Pseudooceanicola nanhaiensis]
MRAPALLSLLLCAAGPAWAGTEIIETQYLCERDVLIPVVYVNDGEGGGPAILVAEGQQVVLPRAVSGSGARYAAPEGVSGYTWWSKGDTGMLGWFDADVGEEVTLFAHCLESSN